MNDEAATYHDQEQEENKKQSLLDVYKNTVSDVRYVLKQYGKQDAAVTLECIQKLVDNPRLKKTKTRK